MTSSEPLASVIVSAYNLGRFLPMALDSALVQDLDAPFEIIVVDDGSTDDTAAVAAAYGDRIRYVYQPNAGVGAAAERGLALAKGEYIAFLDADDEWPPDRLSRHIEALATSPHVGLVHGDMEIIDAGGGVIAPSFFASESIDAPEGRILGQLITQNSVSNGALMFRASLLPAILPIAVQECPPDWWIAVCVASVAEIRVLPGIFNRYRYHGSNMTLRAGSDRAEWRLRRMLACQRWMLSQLVDDPTITVDELTRAWLSLRQVLVALSLYQPGGAHALLGRRTEVARDWASLPAPGAGAPRSRALLAMQAADPLDGANAFDLELALQIERQIGPSSPPPPPLLAVLPPGDLCLCWLPEVLARPELLVGYATDDSAPILDPVVILAPRGSDEQQLARLFASDPRLAASPVDFHVIAEPVTTPARSLVAARARTLLSVEQHPAPYASIPAHGSVRR